MDIFTDQIQTKYLLPNQLVLDIESTGVERTTCYIQVVGLLKCGAKNFTQLLAYDKEDEKNLLERLKIELAGKDLITYNGKNFDIPFIQARMAFHGIDFPEIRSHFDIYNYLVENRFFFYTESFALQAMEEKLAIERFENFEKESDVNFYKSLDDEKLSRICIHNKYDVINTEKLLSFTQTLRKRRSFSFKYEKSIIDSYIEAIIIKNNMCKIKIKASKSYNLNYIDGLKNLKWVDESILIAFPILEGYIAEEQLGNVYIQDRSLLLKDRSKFNLPKAYLVISHDRSIELENIINISKQIIEDLLG